MRIPFTVPTILGHEADIIKDVLARKVFTEGHYNAECQNILQDDIGCLAALTMPSCTAALEAAIILANIQSGDEVILPSYTFTSTATAIVLRGGVPVFVDCNPEDMNINSSRIKSAITDRTKAVMVMHYAGVSCDMQEIREICDENKLYLIEDAAQGIGADYNNKRLGSIGHFSAISFHQTKNINCGEGGALLINDPDYVERAEIIRDKGTNRSQFFRGEVNKYSWQDIGSSYVLSEFQAAILHLQLKCIREITERRRDIWNRYYSDLNEKMTRSGIQTSRNHMNKKHNGHIFYLQFQTKKITSEFKEHMNAQGISASYHYIPLHSSPAGQKFGRSHGDMSVTEGTDGCLVRLPVYDSLSPAQQEFVIEHSLKFIGA